MRPSAASLSSAVSLPFATSARGSCRSPTRPRSSAAGATSTSVTSRPPAPPPARCRGPSCRRRRRRSVLDTVRSCHGAERITRRRVPRRRDERSARAVTARTCERRRRALGWLASRSGAREPGLAAAELGRQRGADADEGGDRPRPDAQPGQQLDDAEQRAGRESPPTTAPCADPAPSQAPTEWNTATIPHSLSSRATKTTRNSRGSARTAAPTAVRNRAVRTIVSTADHADERSCATARRVTLSEVARTSRPVVAKRNRQRPARPHGSASFAPSTTGELAAARATAPRPGSARRARSSGRRRCARRGPRRRLGLDLAAEHVDVPVDARAGRRAGVAAQHR
jgi:hypothetical protein